MSDIKNRRRQRHKNDKVWFGVAVVVAGLFIMLRRFNVLDFQFNFHTMWPWILVSIGLLVGVKNQFRGHAWWIMILIGTLHLIKPFTILGVSTTALLLPAGLILLGLFIIFGKKKKNKGKWGNCEPTATITSDNDNINIDVTFGAHKEIITSKNFRGGRASATFGGIELNFINAATTEKNIELHLSASFGGIELSVPSHWEIKNEIATTLGSVEDKRFVHTNPIDEEQVTLTLKGSCTFGGVEIKSY